MVYNNMCPLKVTQIHLKGHVIVSLYIYMYIYILSFYIKFEPGGQKPKGDT